MKRKLVLVLLVSFAILKLPSFTDLDTDSLKRRDKKRVPGASRSQQ